MAIFIDVDRFENGDMNFKIDSEMSDLDFENENLNNEIFEAFINSAYDNDCEIWGDEFCLSNYEMGMCLYSFYFDKKYIISFSDIDDLKNGKTLELMACELDESDREQWKEDFAEN